MEIYYAWSQLESYRCISAVLGSTGLDSASPCLPLQTLPHPARPPHTLSYHVSNSVELIVLTAQDSCYCTAGLFSQQ